MIETLADVGGSNYRGCDPTCVGVSDKRSEIRSMGPGPRTALGPVAELPCIHELP